MRRRQFWLGVQAVLTVALLGLLFRNFDWQRFTEVLGRVTPAFYLGSFAVVVLGQLLYALRWHRVLAAMGIAIPYWEVFRQYLIGAFFSNLMPTAIGGDAAKVFYLGRYAGYVPIGASVFLDRFLGFFWLAVLGAAIGWIVPASSALFVLNRNLLTVFAAGFVVAMVMARFTLLHALLLRLTPNRARPLAAHVGEFLGLVRDGATQPAMLVVSGAVVVTYIVLLAVVYRQFVAANSLPSIPILAAILVTASVAIFVNVPISVNGIGLREQLHVLLLSELGVPREVSVGISVLLFSYSLLVSLAGWVLWLKLKPVTT